MSKIRKDCPARQRERPNVSDAVGTPGLAVLRRSSMRAIVAAMGPHLKYSVPNGFTALSMLFGAASVVASADGHFNLAAWLILWGVLLDKLDGSAARLLGASSEFGVQYDSFADFIVFGIAPAALTLFRLRNLDAYAGANQYILITCCGVFVLCASGRLARFNTTSPPMGDRLFYGIPTTLVGALVAGFYLTWESQQLPQAALVALPFGMLVAGLSMLSSVKLPKLKLRKNKLVNLFQFANVVAAYVLAPLRLFPEYLFGLAVVYVSVGITWCLVVPPEAPLVDDSRTA